MLPRGKYEVTRNEGIVEFKWYTIIKKKPAITHIFPVI